MKELLEQMHITNVAPPDPPAGINSLKNDCGNCFCLDCVEGPDCNCGNCK